MKFGGEFSRTLLMVGIVGIRLEEIDRAAVARSVIGLDVAGCELTEIECIGLEEDDIGAA
jgi:hypothetical protein